jgi:Response receiver domain
MSENKTDTIRRDIMTKFLRTLVWIDDEIHPDKTEAAGEPFRSFFYPTAQEFQKRKLLVHLHPYDPDTSSDEDDTFAADSESFDSAVALAKRADVIILDWHLGLADRPVNSIKLLKRLKEELAIRYIVVLSQFDDKFEAEMKEGQMLVDDSAKSVESHVFKNIGNAWANNQGTHIIVMKKPDFGSYSPADFSSSVIDAIYALMSKANPDYLHWAAIEIAAKLRTSIPGWVQSIPRGTDAAVLSELSSEQTEARDFIPEHLLEDLSHMAKLHMLQSLDLESCKPGYWSNRPYEIQSIEEGSERYTKFVQLSFSASKLEKKDVDALRHKSTTDEPTKHFVGSQQLFTEFCENISSAPETFPTFGAVYIHEQTDDSSIGVGDDVNRETNTIHLCLSQECDTLRSSSLILLKGNVAQGSSAKEGITKLSVLGKVFGFLPEAQSLQSVAVEYTGDERRLGSFKKIGQLRKATARRILNRFWNHLSRSAVNLSRFTLKDRDGE